MQTLPVILRKNGFVYREVLRNGNKCIYEQSITSELKYFEVFIVKTQPERIFKGKLIEGGEHFPGNEDFGKTAWTYRTLAKAMDKFNSLAI